VPLNCPSAQLNIRFKQSVDIHIPVHIALAQTHPEALHQPTSLPLLISSPPSPSRSTPPSPASKQQQASSCAAARLRLPATSNQQQANSCAAAHLRLPAASKQQRYTARSPPASKQQQVRRRLWLPDSSPPPSLESSGRPLLRPSLPQIQ
jgi:hypothetical protein